MSDEEQQQQYYGVAIQGVLNQAFSDWASSATQTKQGIEAIRSSIGIQSILRRRDPDRIEYLLSSGCHAHLQNLLQFRLKHHTLLNPDVRGTRIDERNIEELDTDAQMTRPVRTFVITVPLQFAVNSPLAPKNVLRLTGPHLAFAFLVGLLILILRWIYIQPMGV